MQWILEHVGQWKGGTIIVNNEEHGFVNEESIFDMRLELDGPSRSTITTPKCVLIHSRFHQILSEFAHFYDGETS